MNPHSHEIKLLQQAVRQWQTIAATCSMLAEQLQENAERSAAIAARLSTDAGDADELLSEARAIASRSVSQLRHAYSLITIANSDGPGSGQATPTT